jgi:hypothetical protein
MVRPSPVPRTRLEQLVRQLRRTNGEFRHDFENTSAQLGRKITISGATCWALFGAPCTARSGG